MAASSAPGEFAAWRKSSYSANNGACVEAASWRKSSRSGTGNCAEVGHGPGVVGVRDSELERSPVLEFPAAAWTAFTARLKDGPGRS